MLLVVYVSAHQGRSLRVHHPFAVRRYMIKILYTTLFVLILFNTSAWAGTFGNTTAGASEYSYGSNNTSCAGPFTTPAGGGTVTSFSSYTTQAGGGAANLIFAVYTNSGSAPGTKLYGGSASAAVPASAGWASSSGENYVLPATATSIWICQMFSTTNGTAQVYYTASGTMYFGESTYPTWISPASSMGNYSSTTGTWSIYATYSNGATTNINIGKFQNLSAN